MERWRLLEADAMVAAVIQVDWLLVVRAAAAALIGASL